MYCTTIGYNELEALMNITRRIPHGMIEVVSAICELAAELFS